MSSEEYESSSTTHSSESESESEECENVKESQSHPFSAQVVSDLHLEINGIFKELIPKNADILILPGDISTVNTPALPVFLKWASKSFSHVIYVPGNHEFYRAESYNEAMEEIKKRIAPYKNIHFLQRSSVLIHGIRFLGCTFWTCPPTDFSEEYIQGSFNDYNHIRVKYEHSHFGMTTRLIRVSDTKSLHKEDVKWLQKMFDECREKDEKCCVVTHHVPLLGTKFLLPQERYNVNTKSDDDKRNLIYGNCTDESDLILRNSDVLDAWFHGHTHLSKISTFGSSDLYSSKNESKEEDEEEGESDDEEEERRIWMISNQVGYDNGWSIRRKDSLYNPDLVIKFPLEKARRDINEKKSSDTEEGEIWGERVLKEDNNINKKKKKKGIPVLGGVLKFLNLKK